MVLSLLTLLLSGDVARADIIEMMICFAALLFCMFVSLPVHESAHAYAAYRLGDETGRLSGRISLNPFDHLSFAGTMLMLFIGVGFAKPVPVNIRNFKNRKLGFALTAVAGPLSNILMSVAAVLVAALIAAFAAPSNAAVLLNLFFFYIAVYNFALALFNLIPIPPLDGSRLVTLVLPDKYYYKLLQYERYFIYIILGLSFLNNRIGLLPSWSDAAFIVVSFLETFLINIFH
ncbi:MAG: site-2 protease family protein [Clostridia bacterium]|nr:site-2 protease family protein [Clostridia bacterium]MBR3955160.1 site-2 protease family protein [Clostridia bacterium]